MFLGCERGILATLETTGTQAAAPAPHTGVEASHQSPERDRTLEWFFLGGRYSYTHNSKFNSDPVHKTNCAR
eukprot:6235958-Pyramimonas_sp.AAC.1